MLATSAARADTDCGAVYERSRQALLAIVRAVGPDGLAQTVPATPAWTVRDVLAHVTGVAADLNHMNFGDGSGEEWTAAQIATRRGLALEAVIAEWEEEAPVFEEGLRALGYDHGSHFVGDLFAHAQDVRAALGLAPDLDELTVLVALDFYLVSLDHALQKDESGVLEVLVGDERHEAGAGPARATVAGQPYEVLRALSGRRALSQVLRLQWSGEVDVLAPLISRYPLPEAELSG